jgi:hypothetical protein
MDMKDVPARFPGIDLLWSEGAAYNIGFAEALASWWHAIVPGGFAVVSELAWLGGEPPAPARSFFEAAYPAMRSVGENRATAERAGYRVLGTDVLPREAWIEGFYDVLGPRAEELIGDPDPAVRVAAAEMLTEIEVFERSEDSYGYVLHVLQRS